LACGSAVLVTLGMMFIQPDLRPNYTGHPMGMCSRSVARLIVMLMLQERQRDVAAFITSSLFILAMLGSLPWVVIPIF
jgi:hypothetical protein